MPFDPRITAARPDLAASKLKGKVTAERFVDGTKMYVTEAVLDLKGSAEKKAPLETQLLHGEVFTVYELRADGSAWGQSERDQYVGYVNADGLSEAGTSPNAQVSALLTHVYRQPVLKTNVVTQLPFLSRLNSDGGENGFVRVGKNRFCPQQHVAPLGAVSSDFVSVAERFSGAPYLWGGRTELGIDCSGLVQVALQAAGENPPRDSDMLASLGDEIGKDEALKRGDLVFWKGHIGIMQDNETILHANAHSMSVASEVLSNVTARIEANGYGGITAKRRL